MVNGDVRDMSGFDLRDYQDDDTIKNIFGKLISGREGYETVIDKNKPIKKCGCGKKLFNDEKFCPECGTLCKEQLCDSVKDCEAVEEC